MSKLLKCAFNQPHNQSHTHKSFSQSVLFPHYALMFT